MLARRRLRSLTSRFSRSITLAALVGAAWGLVAAAPAAASATAAHAAASSQGVYTTASRYYLRFYPRWFSYLQTLPAPANTLVGPKRVTPLYKTVVAINDDTLYASAFTDLTTEPAVLTIPETSVSYSLYTANFFGEVFKTAIPSATAGTYALTGPGWSGTLPTGVTQIPVPYDQSNWIIRSDRYTDGVNTIEEAGRFRESLRLQTLSQYEAQPSGGETRILSELYYAIPYKGIADLESKLAPIRILKQMQTAMHAESTQELLSPGDRLLSARFDALFGEGGAKARSHRKQFAKAVSETHALILRHYLSHTIGNNWINFTNIGAWEQNYLDRDAITEYIQWGNNFGTAAYYHAFEDEDGAALNGSRERAYVLRFKKRQLPKAKRFWSLTAYTPKAIELVRNKARKYLVASYTPNLKTGRDGSVSIYISHRRPRGVPAANWLPAPRGKFNVMLRVYGPEGKAAKGTYVPPGIAKEAR
jgi:hypothetical protein